MTAVNKPTGHGDSTQMNTILSKSALGKNQLTQLWTAEEHQSVTQSASAAISDQMKSGFLQKHHISPSRFQPQWAIVPQSADKEQIRWNIMIPVGRFRH